MATRRDIVYIEGDNHAASVYAACPPDFRKDAGDTNKLSDIQEALWAFRVNTLSQLRELKPRNGGKRWYFNNGDQRENEHHDTKQLVSNNNATMHKIAKAVLSPFCEWADYRFICRGTRAHDGPSGEWTELLASELDGERDEQTGNYSWWNVRVDVQGYVIQLAHHPKAGSARKWTRHGPAVTTAAHTWWEYAESGDKPPDLAIRGHLHRWGDSYDAYPVRCIVVPGWKVFDEHVNRLDPDSLPHIGALIGVIEDGEATWRKVKYQLPRRGAWREDAAV